VKEFLSTDSTIQHYKPQQNDIFEELESDKLNNNYPLVNNGINNNILLEFIEEIKGFSDIKINLK